MCRGTRCVGDSRSETGRKPKVTVFLSTTHGTDPMRQDWCCVKAAHDATFIETVWKVARVAMDRFRVGFGGLVGALAALALLSSATYGDWGGNQGSLLLLAIVALLTATIVLTRALAGVPTVVLGGVVVAAFIATRANPLVTELMWSGWEPVLGLLELSLGVAAVLAARSVAVNIVEFEDAVANITFGDLSRVRSLDAASDEIAVEMSRARRHERPLTVTVLSAEASAVHGSLHRVVQEVQLGMMQRYIMSGLARLAAQTTRRGDIVVQDAANNRVIVLSPEAMPEQVEHLAGRLQFIAADRLGLPVRYGSAGFPSQALTFDDLVAQASFAAGQEVAPPAAPEDEIAQRRRRQSWTAAGDPQIAMVEAADGSGPVNSSLGNVVSRG